MEYQAPGMLEGGSAVARERARTEVLAKAFDDAAGGYFDRLAEHEDNISDAEAEQDRMKKYGAASILVGVALVVAGIFVIDQVLVSAVGVIIALAGAGYAYKTYTEAEERIKRNEARIAENEPDGEVSFVSQIGVPMYLLPYQDDHMVFDGLKTASETTLDLANLDADALIEHERELEQRKRLHDEVLADETVVSPELLEEFAPNVREHRRIEQPILNQIGDMTGVAGDIERDTISASVCANDQKSQSVAEFARGDLLDSNGDLSTVETRHSMAECESVVDEIRGVEEQAISGDMLDQASESRERVDEISTELARRLQTNEERVEKHYEAHAESVDAAVDKHVCSECLSDRIDAIADELGLVDQILSSETGSLGTALSDRDLDRGTDEEFTERIREDIEAAVPELEGELRDAYNRLDDLGSDSGYCEIHGQVETESVPDSGALFGEVWRSLYYAFRDPIMQSVDDLEQEAEDIRQNKEQKMIDLTQYEQIKDEAEQRFFEIKSDYETARNIERRLG
jgi:hypothetical protein